MSTGYFLKIAKNNNSQRKKQFVLIAKIGSRKTQIIANAQKYHSRKNFVPHGMSY